MENLLTNYEMYGPYKELVQTGHQTINVNEEISKDWKSYYDGIINIFKDGIETEFVQNMLVTLVFDNNVTVDLYLVDYWFTLIPWYLLVSINNRILPHHILFVDEFKQSSISNYINKYFIKPNRKSIKTRDMNNIIDDMMHLYQGIDEFALYLSNTINLEDTIKLMNSNHDFYNVVHSNMEGIPIEDIKNEGMAIAYKSIDMIKDAKKYLGYDHCFADSFRASQSINPKQYKEAYINIGTKPDGLGGIFPTYINKSFINGGLEDPVDYFIESSTSRTAQILQKMYVGRSGEFGRLVGLNNTESFLHHDPDYCCDTKRLLQVTISSKALLKKLNNRYYRLTPFGVEHLIDSSEDEDLIGKTVYLRSPMTCASHARGHGICYRCYGDLAYSQNINIGRVASEQLSSVLTQILLSAKHLIEASAQKIEWNEGFLRYFSITGNSIVLNDEAINNYSDYEILINADSIESELDLDNMDEESDIYSTNFNEYITEFILKNNRTEQEIIIKSNSGDNMYISVELNNAIRKNANPVNGFIEINADNLKEIPLFFVHIQNNDLTKIFWTIKTIINTNKGIKNHTLETWYQELLDNVIASDLNITSVHLEVMLSNQIRSVEDPLSKPQWQYPNEPYNIITLNTALKNNPSVLVSLSYKDINRALYSPLTFKKNGASFLDLFFMESPHMYVTQDPKDDEFVRNEDGLIIPIDFLPDENDLDSGNDDEDTND